MTNKRIKKHDLYCNMAFLTEEPTQTNGDTVWYSDSRCSAHMTGDQSKLHSIVKTTANRVAFSDGSRVEVRGQGIMNGQVQPSLGMVHLVDGLTVNLISISQLCDDGLDVTFTKNICTAIDKQGAVRLEGQKSRNNCYTWKSDGVAKKEASLKNLHKYVSDRELVAGCESITLDSMGAVHVELWSQQQSMSLIIDGFSLWTLVRHPCEVSDVLLMTSYAMQKMVTERNHSFHHNRGEIQGDRVTRGLQRGLMITYDIRGWRVAMQQELH